MIWRSVLGRRNVKEEGGQWKPNGIETIAI